VRWHFEDREFPFQENDMFEEPIMHTAGWKTMAALGAAAMLAIGGIGTYAAHEHRVASDLSTQNQQMSAALVSTGSELQELTAKVNTLMAQPATRPAPAPAQNTVASSKPAVHKKHAVEDPRFKKLQSQLDAQGKAIDQTRNDLAGTRDDLSSTRTELTGSIARTHDELVVLQKKGERNYYEFDIAKSKQFSHQGPLGVRLKKANTKHDYADLELMLDDRALSQKHVNIYQPVMFYTPDAPQPVELVINTISKDHIHGYVSSPKYGKSELAAMQSNDASSSASGGAGVVSKAQAQPRQKLPAPR
jgi:hypothetical protein